MARFFFRLHDHDADEGRENGRDLPTLEAAIAVATKELRDFLADQVRNGYLDLGMTIEITDESGRNLAAVKGHEVVELRPDD